MRNARKKRGKEGDPLSFFEGKGGRKKAFLAVEEGGGGKEKKGEKNSP